MPSVAFDNLTAAIASLATAIVSAISYIQTHTVTEAELQSAASAVEVLTTQLNAVLNPPPPPPPPAG